MDGNKLSDISSLSIPWCIVPYQGRSYPDARADPKKVKKKKNEIKDNKNKK